MSLHWIFHPAISFISHLFSLLSPHLSSHLSFAYISTRTRNSVSWLPIDASVQSLYIDFFNVDVLTWQCSEDLLMPCFMPAYIFSLTPAENTRANS